MKSYVEQYTPEFGYAVTTITAGTTQTFKISDVEVSMNEYVILSATVTTQYAIGDDLQMNIQRDGTSITNNEQIMFSKSIEQNAQYPIGVFTYTLSLVDEIASPGKHNYEFMIYEDFITVSILRMTLSAKTISNTLISVKQMYPSIGIPAFLLPYPKYIGEDTKVLLPNVITNQKNMSRFITLNFNIIALSGSILQLEILDPNGKSLTKGLQNIVALNLSYKVQYETNINFILLDSQKYSTSGNYTIRFVNANTQPNEIVINFYSFYVYLIDNKQINSLTEFPENLTSTVETIPTSGIIKKSIKLNNPVQCYNLRNIQILSNFISPTITGNYNTLMDIKKCNQSIINGMFSTISFGNCSQINNHLSIYDKINSGNPEYVIEYHNTGPDKLEIDFLNIIEIAESGKLNKHTTNSIVSDPYASNITGPTGPTGPTDPTGATSSNLITSFASNVQPQQVQQSTSGYTYTFDFSDDPMSFTTNIITLAEAPLNGYLFNISLSDVNVQEIYNGTLSFNISCFTDAGATMPYNFVDENGNTLTSGTQVGSIGWGDADNLFTESLMYNKSNLLNATTSNMSNWTDNFSIILTQTPDVNGFNLLPNNIFITGKFAITVASGETF
jgi:hypothetical protein